MYEVFCEGKCIPVPCELLLPQSSPLICAEPQGVVQASVALAVASRFAVEPGYAAVLAPSAHFAECVAVDLSASYKTQRPPSNITVGP